ncbi:MAG TPA: cytochrome c [Holophagaceae bacterium]|nr:cytochrome c [Holophagaceae bacterium]
MPILKETLMKTRTGTWTVLGALAVAIAAVAAVGCGDANGLSTQAAKSKDLVQAAAYAPQSIEPDSSDADYPLGKPSALAGRSVYQANCAVCHGTYLTAAEKIAWDKQKDMPVAAWNEDTQRLVDERRYPGDTPAAWLASHQDKNGKPLEPNALWQPKNGPDFYSRDWRFERTPGQLFRLIAFGQVRSKLGDPSSPVIQHPGPVVDADGKPVLDASGQPTFAMGRGWISTIKDDRGNQIVAPGDPAPVWNTVYYVWSRSIAAVNPNHFAEVWGVYGQNCNVCHGTIAKGDGFLANTLNPMPFNFQNRKALAEQTDEFLYWRISEGGQFTHIPESVRATMSPQALNLYVHQWSAMPAWKGVLSDTDRWMAVDGVRSVTYDHE